MPVHEGDLRSDDRIVGHSDILCQQENVGKTDMSEVLSVASFGSAPFTRAQHLESQASLSDFPPSPEFQPGEFLRVINDLARAWRLRRSIATVQYIVDRDVEIIRYSLEGISPR